MVATGYRFAVAFATAIVDDDAACPPVPPSGFAELPGIFVALCALSNGTLRRVALMLLAATALAGCAQRSAELAAAAPVHEDPLEPLNRQIFEANLLLDRILLRPIAQVYVTILPEDGREVMRRMLDNMKEPTIFFNNVLQGELERAGITLGRLTVNTTLGVGGVADVATKMGLPRQPADFGQTLFVWGVPEGPYLVLPIVGPSNPRDAIGMGVDSYADPVSLLAKTRGLEEISIGRFVADGVDQRGRVIDLLDDLQKNSLDFYAELRSLSQQHRDAELRRGATPTPAGDFYSDPGQPRGGATPVAAPAKSTPPAAPAPRRKMLAAAPSAGP